MRLDINDSNGFAEGDTGCPVRVIKWGEGDKVTIKLRKGLEIVNTQVDHDGVGDAMYQLFVKSAQVSKEEARLAILKELDEGDIGTAEALERLTALDAPQDAYFAGVGDHPEE